jgi:preprotein translocase subunit SecA
VGTISIEKSEHLSSLLKKEGIKLVVLNAKYHEREAEIVAQAGQPAAITIATNMAGRGTDIKLGPGVKKCQVCGIKSNQAPFGQRIEPPDLTPAKIAELQCNEDPPCGLVIIGTERHEARRIDRQLRGRSGRQGDPGQSVFFLSLEDDLMRLFGSDRIARLMDRSGAEENEVITHPWVTSAIGQAQKRVELQNFQQRKRLLEYDDVMNQQREVIYSLRRFALEGGQELKAEARAMVEDALVRLAEGAIAEYEDPERWDRELMATEFLQRFLVSVPGLTDATDRGSLVAAVQAAGRDAFEAKLDYLRDIGSKVGAGDVGPQVLAQLTLGVIDEKWKDHLYDLDQLRAAIQYRAWGQKDPLIEYKQEAFEMFKGLMADLHTTFAERWLRLQLEIGPPGAPPRRGPAPTLTGPLGGRPRGPTPMVASKPDSDGLVTDGVPPPPPPPSVGDRASVYAGVGRNDPCPCGSGKKFKKCHGAAL